MSKEEAEAYRTSLSVISEVDVRKDYEKYWRSCELKPGFVPRPGVIQRLLNAWKVLWKQEELSRTLKRDRPQPKGIAPEEYETPD